ncbi:molybdopterin molybdotransferase MoeA [Luteimonas sp. SX5]|uniref:Molybdopterin molybdenumtransferase n=1 Tax=Luteimonas galliterrae TaxID=2940486 RepID=A0ABT0MFF0_9GAMM|nr:gephyrin-like molybdotransferase Glp [Luteimonas galliterrae]MCL1633602.1 molybdopterin molybdotransferase MoeA [Luteimonas galliterrae]
MNEFPTRIAFEQARSIVESVAAGRQLPSEGLALPRAHGRVLAQDAITAIPLPPFDNSAMDGYALRHADLGSDGDTALRLVGEQFAGLSLDLRIGPGQCSRITTGAPMPQGADTVVMKENTRIDGDTVRVLIAPKPGAHVRRAGEDTKIGDRVLQAGQPLTPSRIALAASIGMAALEVAQRPTVAVFTTGDELVEPGLPLRPGQIYNSNRELLMGLLRADGLEPTAWPTLPDDPARIESMLRDAAQAFDIVITCGAVSAGEKDFIPTLLQSQGRVHFWKVRMRPGMPLLFGELERALFLGLPGNPVSVLATYLTLGRMLVDGLQGRGEPRPRFFARLSAPWHKAHERLEFLRGRLQSASDGILHVQPNPADGSHRMRAAADSDALIVLPERVADYAVGGVVEVLPY